MYGLAIGQGDLAKALEALDHMEEGPHRSSFESGVISIAHTVLEASSTLGLDLVAMTCNRWKYVEQHKVL